MPRVPQQDNFQTSISTNRGPAFQTPSGPQAGDIGAQQATNFSQSVGKAGGVASSMALDIQQETNKLRIIDATNKAKEIAFDLDSGESGYKSLKGFNALNRPDGKSLVDEYDGMLSERVASIEKDLSNDVQKQMFRQNVSNIRMELRDGINRHTLSEFRTYQSSVYDGAADTAKRQIELNYQRVEPGGLIDQSIDTIKASIREKARLTGVSIEVADNAARREISSAHRLALRTAIEQNDIDFADEYLKKYGDSMEPDDILAVRGTITKEMDSRQAYAAAQTAVTLATPKLAQTDWDRIVNITIQTESTGKPNAVSSKGAKGLMQVMDDTNLDPGFGVKPAKDKSREERVRVGRDYLAAMLKRYAGDPAKAWAAYNAGAKWVDSAIARADKWQGKGDAMSDWMWQLNNDRRDPANRKQTSDYVEKNMRALNAGSGAQPKPTLADVKSQVRAVLGQNAKPSVIKAAEDEAERRWDDQLKALKEQDESLMAEAQRGLFANGGDFAGLSPNLKAALSARSPEKITELMGFSDKLRKGQEPETDWSLYYKLASDPALLKVTNLDALRHKLGAIEFKQLTNDQATVNKGGDSVTQLQSAKDVLNSFMEQAGINPNPNYKDDDAAKRVAQLTSKFQERINAREKAIGKKLGTNELREEAAALFMPVKVPGLIWDDSKVASEITPADAVVVPDSERLQIEAALKRSGRPVTKQAVESLYRSRLRIPQRQAAN